MLNWIIKNYNWILKSFPKTRVSCLSTSPESCSVLSSCQSLNPTQSSLKIMAPPLSRSAPGNIVHWWNHLRFRLRNRKGWDEVLDETFLCQSKRLFFHKHTDTCHCNQSLQHHHSYGCGIRRKWYCAVWISSIISAFAHKSTINTIPAVQIWLLGLILFCFFVFLKHTHKNPIY